MRKKGKKGYRGRVGLSDRRGEWANVDATVERRSW